MQRSKYRESFPDWSNLPSELLHEVAKQLLLSQTWAFSSVCRSWRQAVLPLVTTLHAPLVSDVTLPSGPPGSDRLDVIRQYVTSRRHPHGRASGATPTSTASAAAAAGPSASPALDSNGNAVGGIPDWAVDPGVPSGGGGRGSEASNAASNAASTAPDTAVSAGTTPPLLAGLLVRFPFVRRLGLHRSSLQHPAFEAAALQCMAATQPALTQLCLYDTLAWDFPLQLGALSVLSNLTSLKLWGLGAPGLDPSAQWAFSRGLMSLSSLTLLQELTLRWLFGRQEVVWTCGHTPRLLRALTDGGAQLRSLDLNAFMLDRAAAASLARVTSLRSLSLYFDAEGAGWEEVVSLMALPELTRLILSYEGDAMTGPWVGDGPPAAAEDQPAQLQPQGQGHVPAVGVAAAPAAGNPLQNVKHPHPNHHNHHHDGHPNGGGQASLHSNGGAGGAAAAAAGSAPPGSSPAPLSAPLVVRRPLPSWASRPYSLQYLSLTTSPTLHRLLGRLDCLLPYLTYLSLSSVGEFGGGQRELEAGLMAMAQSGSQLARIKLFCMELRPELLAALIALPCLQELMLFNVWVAVEGPQAPPDQGQQQPAAGQLPGQQQQAVAPPQAQQAPQQAQQGGQEQGQEGQHGQQEGQPAPGEPAVPVEGPGGAAAAAGAAAGGEEAAASGGAAAGGEEAAASAAAVDAEVGVRGPAVGGDGAAAAEAAPQEAEPAAGPGLGAAEAAPEPQTATSRAVGTGAAEVEAEGGTCSRGVAAMEVDGTTGRKPRTPGASPAARSGEGAAAAAAMADGSGAASSSGDDHNSGGGGDVQMTAAGGVLAVAAAAAAGPAGGSAGPATTGELGRSGEAGQPSGSIGAGVGASSSTATAHLPPAGGGDDAGGPPAAAAPAGGGGGAGGGGAVIAAQLVHLQHLLDHLPPAVLAELGADERIQVQQHLANMQAWAAGNAPMAPQELAHLQQINNLGAHLEGLMMAQGLHLNPGPNLDLVLDLPALPGVAVEEDGEGVEGGEGEGAAAGGGGAGVAGEADAAEGEGGPEGLLLRNALRATAVAQAHLQPLAQLAGQLKQLLIEFGPEGSTCFITQDLVRVLEPLGPSLRSLHLLSWNMEGLMLPYLEPLCFTAFTALKSLSIANRISPDSQVNFAAPLPETSGHVIYLGQLPKTLTSLCANRVNIRTGVPPPPPPPTPAPAAEAAAPSPNAAAGASAPTGAANSGAGGRPSGPSARPSATFNDKDLIMYPLSGTIKPTTSESRNETGSGYGSGSARQRRQSDHGGPSGAPPPQCWGLSPEPGPSSSQLSQPPTAELATTAHQAAAASAAAVGGAVAGRVEGRAQKAELEEEEDQEARGGESGGDKEGGGAGEIAQPQLLGVVDGDGAGGGEGGGAGGSGVDGRGSGGGGDGGGGGGLFATVLERLQAERGAAALAAVAAGLAGTAAAGAGGGRGSSGYHAGIARWFTTSTAAAAAAASVGPVVSCPLLHLWLADCNVSGAPAEELAGALPALQTLVVRHVSKPDDLPPQLLLALKGLKDLTTLGLGGFHHRLIPHLTGLTQLRHLMLDPRRFEDVELDPEMWLDAAMADGDRSLALHEAALGLVAGGLRRLRSLWMPDWAVPPHQLVQWQLQMAQVAPLVALRLVDHHYFWRLPAPVGCPEVQDRLQWWGFDAWNVL